MKLVRCSSLDRVLACAGSLAEIDAPYTPLNPEAREGTACHEALVALTGGQIPPVDAIGERHGVDPDVISKVVLRGQQAWREVERWFKGDRYADSVRYSASLSGDVELRGTPDLLAVEHREIDGRRVVERLAILDWKTGWDPSEHPNQLRGYAFLARAMFEMPACGYVLGVEVWVRRQEIRIHKFTAEQLDRLRVEVLTQVAVEGRQYGPSHDACRYCPLQNSCAARADWLRSGVTALAPADERLPISRELIGSLYERRKQLGAALKRYDEVLDAMLDEGPVPLPDGRKLVWHDDEQDKLVPSRAMAFLDELDLTTAERDEVLSMTKAGLERVLKARAPERQGASWMRKAMTRLDELGAVEKTTKRTRKTVA